MATRRYNDAGAAMSAFNMDMAADVAKVLDYGNVDLFAAEEEPKEEPMKTADKEPAVEVVEKEAEKTEEITIREKAPKQVKKQKGSNVKSREKTPVPATQAEYIGRRGRKTTYTEPRFPQFGNCGKDAYDKMTDLRYRDKKNGNEYMCELIRREKEAYEKNPESYVASRRKKAEALYKKDKGGTGSINFKTDKEISDFINDIPFELRCSKELFFRAIIELEYEKKFK